jgi:hydroxymethylbilane synthase
MSESMNHIIRIGSRESRLAVIQSELVRDYINSHSQTCEARIVTMKTTGDKILDQPLEKIGGKGLFVKELDRALMEHETDLSVHSLKDVPMELPEELPLIGFSVREDPRDVLVLPEGKTEIDFSRPIGCSSRRRMVQLQAIYPQAVFQTIRGNVQTRLRKLDSGEYSATILAAAGLKRLGLEHRISRYFSVEEMIPAAGQAILAIQGRAGEDYSVLDGYTDESARVCALAERAFVRYLGGSCSTPIAAYAQTQDETVTLRALYLDEATGRVHRGMQTGSVREPEQVGKLLAEQFLEEK